MGEPYLYKFKVVVKDTKTGDILDEHTFNYGIKTVQLITEKDSKGKSFYFKLNNIPIFAKGSNYVVGDSMFPLMARNANYYKDLIKDAVDANYNMVRLWGGASYDNDEFYN